MDRRIIGIETEYGIAHSHPGSRSITPEEVARYLFKPVVEWGRSSNVFLTNGARLYLDVGSHPEYATSECDDLLGLISQDLAGESIMRSLIERGEALMHEDGIQGSIYLFKNNSDSAGNSFGCHENYMIPRKLEFSRLSELMIPFLVTRQLICGAGKVNLAGDNCGFHFSQRADHVWEGVSSATTRSRPIINTRDEPHADAERFRRMHVIVGDSNMSQTTQLLKVGATDLVLRLIESGAILGDLKLENPIRSIREISRDLTGRQEVRLASGRSMSALEIQRFFLQHVTAFVEKNGAHHAHVSRVLELWERALDAIETQNLGLIDKDIDWAIKKRLIDAYMAKNSLELSSPRVAQIDLTYHDISLERGLFHVLERRGAASTVVTPESVEEAVTVAPQTTRAKIRGEFIKAAREHGRDVTADWLHLKVNDAQGATVLLKDPFVTEDAAATELINAIRGV